MVFDALKAYIGLNEFALGTFKNLNDYIAANELVFGVYDVDVTGLTAAEAAGHLVVEYVNGAWKATQLAATLYGFDVVNDTFAVEIDENLVYAAAGNTYDTKASFGGRLNVRKAGTQFSPAPNAQLTEDAIDWWNMGTDLQVNKYAGFKIKVNYTANGAAAAQKIAEGEGVVTVLSTDNSKVAPKLGKPYHIEDPNNAGTYYWDPAQTLVKKGIVVPAA